jgi:hypothetical protein
MQFPWSPKNEDNNNKGGMSSETSSLLPSNASGSGSSYYFLKGEATEGTTNSVRDADGGEVIDILPPGATENDFASRPVGQRVSRSLVMAMYSMGEAQSRMTEQCTCTRFSRALHLSHILCSRFILARCSTDPIYTCRKEIVFKINLWKWRSPRSSNERSSVR